MILFVLLLLAHLAGDFFLQPFSWVQEKERLRARSPKLYYHILIHALLAWLMIFELQAWPVALIIGVSHFLIDWMKLSFQDLGAPVTWFVVDQLAHVAVLVACALWWTEGEFWPADMLDPNKVLLIFSGAVFLTRPMSIIMMVALKRWADTIPQPRDQALESAGSWIGMLERVLVYTFILVGQWGAVGFLLAAKSVFRFGDLREAREHKLTEYILIGTLISFGVSILTALLVEGGLEILE